MREAIIVVVFALWVLAVIRVTVVHKRRLRQIEREYVEERKAMDARHAKEWEQFWEHWESALGEEAA